MGRELVTVAGRCSVRGRDLFPVFTDVGRPPARFTPEYRCMKSVGASSGPCVCVRARVRASEHACVCLCV